MDTKKATECPSMYGKMITLHVDLHLIFVHAAFGHSEKGMQREDKQ